MNSPETNEFIIDAETDNTLFITHNSAFMDVVHARLKRKADSLSEYMSGKNSPLPTLEELQENLNFYTEMQNNPSCSQDFNSLIQETQNKIDNNEYCIEGSEEMAYRQEYFAFRDQFMWPTSEESVLREQETAMLKSLL